MVEWLIKKGALLMTSDPCMQVVYGTLGAKYKRQRGNEGSFNCSPRKAVLLSILSELMNVEHLYATNEVFNKKVSADSSYTTKKGREALIALALEAVGDDLNVLLPDGHTLLEEAQAYGNEEIERMLIAQGAVSSYKDDIKKKNTLAFTIQRDQFMSGPYSKSDQITLADKATLSAMLKNSLQRQLSLFRMML